MGGRLAAGFGFKLVYLYTAELFPTAIRSTAVGTNSTAGRVGYGVSKSQIILQKKHFLCFLLLCHFFLLFFIVFLQGSLYIFFFQMETLQVMEKCQDNTMHC